VTVRLAVSAVVNVAAIQQIVDLAVGGDHLVQCLADFYKAHDIRIVKKGNSGRDTLRKRSIGKEKKTKYICTKKK
jgi:hypothetical protein